MDIAKVSEFIISVIDDKAVQIEILRLTKKESDAFWDSFNLTLRDLYNPLEVPETVQQAINRYFYI